MMSLQWYSAMLLKSEWMFVCVCVYMNVFQARWSVRIMTQINAANLNIASRVFFVSVISEGQVGQSQTLGGGHCSYTNL